MAKELHIFNSLTRKKEKFEPLNPPFVGMYVCGPTVYSDVHLGNIRTFLAFDIIYRYLKHLDYKVRYVRNITDVGHLESDADEGEDKISKKAKLMNLEPMEIVHQYTNGFHNVLRSMNILPPDIEPSATGHIVEKIGCIEEIAHLMKYIDDEQLRRLAEPLVKSGYGEYLIRQLEKGDLYS